MAKAAPLQSIDSLSGVDARMEALDQLEQLTDELAAEVARHKSNVALKRAIRSWRKGDIVKGGQLGAEGHRDRRKQRQGLSCAGDGAGADGPSAQGAGHL